LPVVGVGYLVARYAFAALDLIFTPAFGLVELAAVNGWSGSFARRVLSRHPAIRSLNLNRNTLWSASILVAAAVFSLGWGSSLGVQLSPRLALARFDSLSKPGEPLGLLGTKPQIIQYYSRTRPELLLDPDEGADWLLFEKSATRWMLVKGDLMPRLNAAYRERCKCLQNVPVVDTGSSDIFLVSNHRIKGVTDVNPYDDIVPDHPPKPQQTLDADLGRQIEVLGWELVAPNGHSVAELKVGRRYELKIYYKVLSRPTMDWETFVHIDGYGRRYNGDHSTTQGRYPTSNWRPGDIVIDTSTIVLDPSFSRGNYQLYFGLYKGSRRLDVGRGRQDENRLLAGTLRID